jgi:predicted RNA-binding Zn ribbon-like protein
MKKAKAKNDSDWKAGFLFLGNHLALDFLNTRPVQHGEPVELLPDLDALLRWFQAADLLTSRQAAKLQQQWDESSRAWLVVDAMRELRERLRKEIIAWEDGGVVHHSTVDELNNLMADHPMRTRLKASGAVSSTELWFEPHQPEDLFAPLAHSSAILFANVDRSRVRQCVTCVLHFYDTSKKGTRHWCSMRLCGNRVKVAAYAARRRGLDTNDSPTTTCSGNDDCPPRRVQRSGHLK